MQLTITKNDIASFTKVFHACCIEYGIDAVIAKLSEISSPNSEEIKKLIQDKILDVVSQIYHVSPKEILTGKTHNVSAPKILTILLFEKHLGLRQKAIAGIFKEDATTINKKIRMFVNAENGNADPNSSYGKIFSKEFMDNYSKVNSIIKDYAKKVESANN